MGSLQRRRRWPRLSQISASDTGGRVRWAHTILALTSATLLVRLRRSGGLTHDFLERSAEDGGGASLGEATQGGEAIHVDLSVNEVVSEGMMI